MSFIASLDKKIETEQMDLMFTIKLNQEEDNLLTLATQNTGYKRNELIYLLMKKYIFDDECLKDMASRSKFNFSETTYPNCYVVNTNIVNEKDDDNFMIKNGFAATFEEGYTTKMYQIKKGDLVFLYRSGEGIVAHGIGSGQVLKKDHNGVPDKTYYQKLSDFVRYDKPLTPSEIQRRLGRNVVFMHTLFSIKDGYKLLVPHSRSESILDSDLDIE